MRRVKPSLLLGLIILVPVVLIVLAGCSSGGGGPITQPETGPGTSPSAEFIALLPASQRSATTVGNETCANCHRTYHTDWTKTRHAQVNAGCESCHGPGSAHAATPTLDNILTGGNVTSPTVCGQCHGPTHDQFMNSRHASAVHDVIEEAHSNPKQYVATCFRCHSAAFRMKMVDDPMARGKTRDQVDADIAALTAEQLAAFIPQTHESATCGTCHDPHRNTANLTSTGNQAYLRRATFNSDTANARPGAPVREYTTINHICGSCHNGRGANPGDDVLRTASRPAHEGLQYIMLNGKGGVEGNGPVQRVSSHSTAPDQCVHCHMPDRRHTFTVSLDTSCAPCHTPTDAAARSQAVRSETLSSLLQLRTRMERWATATFNEAEFWDYPSLLSAEGLTPPNQTQVPIEIKRARYNYYFVLRDRSFGVHNTPYTRHLMNIAHQQLDTLGISRSAPLRQTTTRQVLETIGGDLRRAKAAETKEHW